MKNRTKEEMFWHIRRELKISDAADVPEIDLVIRQEMKNFPKNVSIDRIKYILKCN